MDGLDPAKAGGGPPRDAPWVVGDLAAGVWRREAAEIVRLVDVVVLVPVTPSALDEAAAEAFPAKLAEPKPVRGAKRTAGVVGNRLRPRTKATEQLDAFRLAGLGHPIVARLRDAWVDATAAGSGVTAFDRAPAPARAHLDEGRPPLRFIDDGGG